jgi:hypothetical protein
MRTLLCIVVVIGCARFGSPRASQGSYGAAGNVTREPPSNPAPAAAVQTDFKPNAAFREYAAAKLGVTPAEVEGGSINAAGAKAMPNSVGNAWAFTMWLKSDRAREVRGWATPDGTVITPDQNLGLLFAEAGVWGKGRGRGRASVLAEKLAALLVWSYGMNNAVAKEGDIEPPSLEFKAGGGGRLRFVSSYRAPGGDSFAGGPKTYTKNLVTLTRGGNATLMRAPYRRR